MILMSEMWRPQENETLRTWILTILDEASDELNDWETNFISNVYNRVFSNQPLTQNQEERLEQIYAHKTK